MLGKGCRLRADPGADCSRPVGLTTGGTGGGGGVGSDRSRLRGRALPASAPLLLKNPALKWPGLTEVDLASGLFCGSVFCSQAGPPVLLEGPLL